MKHKISAVYIHRSYLARLVRAWQTWATSCQINFKNYEIKEQLYTGLCVQTSFYNY